MAVQSVVVCLTAAAVAGCGAGPAGSAGASATGTVTWSPTPAGTAPAGGAGSHPKTLTVADDGHTIRLRAGQAVVVVLASGGLMWDIPKAAGALRRTEASGGYPTGRPARATFLAVRRGTSTITSVTDARCLHARPRCEIAQRLWRVVIIVR